MEGDGLGDEFDPILGRKPPTRIVYFSWGWGMLFFSF